MPARRRAVAAGLGIRTCFPGDPRRWSALLAASGRLLARRPLLGLPFIPSLKPLTAPPRSWPMLRSFLVPNTSMTITKTISQCQNAEGTHLNLLKDYRGSIGPTGSCHLRCACQMHDFLPADAV